MDGGTMSLRCYYLLLTTTCCRGLCNGDGKFELCTVDGARDACREPGKVYSAECTVDGQWERGKGHSARAAAMFAGVMSVIVG